MAELQGFNPTAAINLDFGGFLSRRQEEIGAHSPTPTVADYAFGMDRVLRQKIASFSAARKIVRALVHHITPIQRQLHMMGGVAVGPRQFPEIHGLGQECARRLGIGVPQIFIVPSPQLNAYTFATDDVAPMVVLSSSLVEAMDPGELTFVIGHECGHVANLHGAYNSVIQSLANPLARAVAQQLSGAGVALKWITTVGQLKLVAMAVGGSLQLFMMRWSRCAEVTCDRAGLICCGDLETAQLALARIGTGGVASLKGINIQEYIRQMESVRGSAMRFQELFHTHPLIPKRLEALRLFAHCEVFHAWRPEVAKPATPRSLEEVDEACKGAIGVLSSDYQAPESWDDFGGGDLGGGEEG